ncbi:MAG: aminopeptidase P family protein, partial [Bacteroidia bacterium]|nr:aminopeptidase P family protein [Bacteroidia bacterium]
MNIDQRLSSLRQQMDHFGIDAYILPSGDPHQSEYPASHWKSREWISGFTGSAGSAVITLSHAGLWTDSRYFLQAEEELSSSSFELHKMLNQFQPGYISWLSENLAAGSKVAIDGALYSLAQRKQFEKILSEKNIELVVTQDFIGSVWEDRPAIPVDKIFEHDVSFAGKSRETKLTEIRHEMRELGASKHLVTTLDDIAWMYNLRGYDVEYNPVFVAYTVISEDETLLFINEAKVPEDIRMRLEKDKVYLRPYESIIPYLNTLGQNDWVLINEGTTNIELFNALKHAEVISGPLISRHLKAVKNETELDHFRQVMVKDGVALTHAFRWLENTVKERAVSEFEFSNKLAECRSQQEHYYGESFGAIIGYKGNGAIIHYRPDKEKCAMIHDEGILLSDSGGQYLDGTTDITRTISFSEPTAEEKNAYTRVLKGHISLSMAVFPEGTTGGQLDMLARKDLWQDGLNFLHGTGHGVGFFMNVHEPPQGFAPGGSMRARTKHVPGMVTTNEPGYYEENKFGIRIENLLVAKKSSFDGFLDFETITLFPIDTSLIDQPMLTRGELE